MSRPLPDTRVSELDHFIEQAAKLRRLLTGMGVCVLSCASARPPAARDQSGSDAGGYSRRQRMPGSTHVERRTGAVGACVRDRMGRGGRVRSKRFPASRQPNLGLGHSGHGCHPGTGRRPAPRLGVERRRLGGLRSACAFGRCALLRGLHRLLPRACARPGIDSQSSVGGLRCSHRSTIGRISTRDNWHTEVDTYTSYPGRHCPRLGAGQERGDASRGVTRPHGHDRDGNRVHAMETAGRDGGPVPGSDLGAGHLRRHAGGVPGGHEGRRGRPSAMGPAHLYWPPLCWTRWAS